MADLTLLLVMLRSANAADERGVALSIISPTAAANLAGVLDRYALLLGVLGVDFTSFEVALAARFY